MALRVPVHRKRVAVFFDGRNARGAVANAYSDKSLADFNPKLLAKRVCESHGWKLASVSYYVGVPKKGRMVRGESKDDWEERIEQWQRQGVRVVTRPLTGHNKEKGIDVRLALDVTHQFRRGHYDVALIFSQDQDFREVIDELRDLARLEGRRIETACAYPGPATGKLNRGIDNADHHISVTADMFRASLESGATLALRPKLFGVSLPDYRIAPAVFSVYLGVALATFLLLLTQNPVLRSSHFPGVGRATMAVAASGAAGMVWPVYWSNRLQRHKRVIAAVAPVNPGPDSGAE